MGRRALYATEEERQAARKEYYKQYQNKRRQARRQAIVWDSPRRGYHVNIEKEALFNNFKKGGCIGCEENFPGCIDAHHLRDKEYNISELLTLGTLELFTTELAKCVPLCANCHRKHHAGLPIINSDGTRYELPEGRKTCNQCHQELPLTSFELRYEPHKPAGSRRGTCRVCRGQNTHGNRSRESN